MKTARCHVTAGKMDTVANVKQRWGLGNSQHSRISRSMKREVGGRAADRSVSRSAGGSALLGYPRCPAGGYTIRSNTSSSAAEHQMLDSSSSSQTIIDSRWPPARITEAENGPPVVISGSSVGDAMRDPEPHPRALSSSLRRRLNTSKYARRVCERVGAICARGEAPLLQFVGRRRGRAEMLQRDNAGLEVSESTPKVSTYCVNGGKVAAGSASGGGTPVLVLLASVRYFPYSILVPRWHLPPLHT
ncbi:hypothetical protein EDB84DRAFT_1444698 [Lactarius hengduanensis]|nr:hypothetical protein EDB84DRAFT_1444698 [Lactarius hengduanensis]